MIASYRYFYKGEPLQEVFNKDLDGDNPLHFAYMIDQPDVRQILRQSRLIDPRHFVNQQIRDIQQAIENKKKKTKSKRSVVSILNPKNQIKLT
jgi:ankyrin repeat protein